MVARTYLLLAALLITTIVACSSSEEPATEATAPTTEPGPAVSVAPEVTVVPAMTDIAVGPNRFAFGVLQASRPVRVPESTVSFVFLEASPPESRGQATARFIPWPGGSAGVYTVETEFDQAGRWGAVVDVVLDDGSAIRGQFGFIVKPESASPGIGKPAIPSRNKTAGDVGDLSEMTTALVPDPDLYEMTIEDAVSSGWPTLLTFATPAYCQTATCGPQVEVVSALKDRYKDRANFIHVEVYDNPKEIQGDLSRGRLSPTLQEWGLLSEPFTFVIDQAGLIAAKFEGFATEAELEAALNRTLGS